MNIIKKYISLFILAGIGMLPTIAQKVYTLDECVTEALRNNVRIKNADNNLSAARHTRKETFTKYFPTISASGGGFMVNKELLRLGLGETKLALVKNGLLGNVSATMPLFAGGQIVHANQLAGIDVEVKRLQRSQSENEVELTTEQFFWQIVMLKEKLKTLGTIEEQLSVMHKDVETAVEAGVSNRNDLLQVQLRKNEMRTSRIQVENALSVSRNLLAQYMGHPADSIEVETSLSGTLPESPDELYRQPDASLSLTDEYNLLQQQVKAAKLQYKMSIGKNLPNVAIGGGYSYNDLMGSGRSSWIGFVSVNVSLSGWWGGSHDMKKQKLQLRNTENQLTDQSEQLIIHMRNTWNQLTDAYEQVRIAMESIGQASENLRLQTDYYQTGTCTMSDLLEAQSLYRQSRDQYVEAYATYEITKRAYLQATGR